MKSFPVFERRVNFADTDLAGIVHFSNILRFIEEAEHAAMFSAGVAPVSNVGGFPKVHVKCDYRSPLKFGDVADILLEIVKMGEKSLSWNFKVYAGQRVVAEGTMVTVFVTSSGEGTVIPLGMREALES
ncbi:acyl-CoA thioesterase [Rubritalea spongiae]|uniref:Acyl-CoA thioesterase n=1 Tax=Rubritalea spongiae TaxID=430797 RepID=A0ABW5E1T9_9BACT